MILLDLFILIVGFALLIKGAEYFVDGASNFATSLKIPQLIIGLTIVAMGTSLPEAAVSITAALEHNADIAIGNVVGSNILNILIILGITALIKNMTIQKSTFKVEIPYMIFITAVLILMGLDGLIFWYEGLILLALFAAYLVYLFRTSKKQNEDSETSDETSEEVEIYPLKKSILFIILGISIVVLGSNLAVKGATAIATHIGISERIIGLTIVAFGTSLPELVTSVVAARKNNSDIAIGNIIGSNIFNILFILGTSALITPLVYEAKFLIDGIIAIFAGALLWISVRKNMELQKNWGYVFLASYAIYFIYILAMTN